MGNFHAITLNNVGELQRSYLFKVIFSGMSGESFDILMSSAKLPTMTISDKKIPVLSSNFKVPETVNYETWSATFMDVENGVNYNSIYNWQSKVFNRTGLSVGFPADYKRNATMQLLSTDGLTVKTFIVEGIWPLSITSGDLAHGNNDMLKYTTTFAIDRFKVS